MGAAPTAAVRPLSREGQTKSSKAEGVRGTEAAVAIARAVAVNSQGAFRRPLIMVVWGVGDEGTGMLTWLLNTDGCSHSTSMMSSAGLAVSLESLDDEWSLG